MKDSTKDFLLLTSVVIIFQLLKKNKQQLQQVELVNNAIVTSGAAGSNYKLTVKSNDPIKFSTDKLNKGSLTNANIAVTIDPDFYLNNINGLPKTF